MVSSERPDGSERDERERVRRLEGILPELVKRVLEAGYERLSEGPENVRFLRNNSSQSPQRFVSWCSKVQPCP